ncbi:MAG TPA: hypothetical protein VEA59_03265 [Patescibacteria group bacterium]|nr:hypothetical protein [Patescibacteria group bacterium]
MEIARRVREKYPNASNRQALGLMSMDSEFKGLTPEERKQVATKLGALICWQSRRKPPVSHVSTPDQKRRAAALQAFRERKKSEGSDK